jgi:predicted dienelactone hydrolase
MTSSFNRIDGVAPDAPALAGYGPYGIGVRTQVFVNPAQVNYTDPARGVQDRRLVAEVWYPADCDSGLTTKDGVYDTLLRDGVTPVRLYGQAQRGAQASAGAFPLVIISHGYPGNRMLMGHLGETLASRGYVVASIDHPDSTYADKGAFLSTLINRPLDVRFVADQMGVQAYGIIGYSMGGYGALVSGGAAVSQAAVAMEPQGEALAMHRTVAVDPRLKAIIPIGPWGRKHGVWDAEGLAQLRVPALIMAGSDDEVSGYGDGMRLIFEQAPGCRLLTFEAAGHNAAAPYPAPQEAFAPSAVLDFVPAEHYADPVWDTLRMNGIAQHFAAAFLGLHLQADAGKARYLDEDFAGFQPGTTDGLRLE